MIRASLNRSSAGRRETALPVSAPTRAMRPNCPMEAQHASKATAPRLFMTTSAPASPVSAWTISPKSRSGATMSSSGLQISQGRLLLLGAGDGQHAGPQGPCNLHRVDAQPAAGPRDHRRLAGAKLGGVAEGVQGHTHGAGEEAGAGVVDPERQLDQAGFADRRVLGETAVGAVPDAHAEQAPVLAVAGAVGARAAGVGKDRRDAVAGRHSGDQSAALHDFAGDLVAQDELGLDAAAERAAHDQDVVIAEAAGADPHQGFPVADGRQGDVAHLQLGRVAGLNEKEGSHSRRYTVARRKNQNARAMRPKVTASRTASPGSMASQFQP